MGDQSSPPVSPTKEKSLEIKAINKDTVHRICSGQVVLNLATAVKELVENSLDAGTTVIEVRLHEYGSELLEVSDNGAGVQEENFAGLTLKHHTSKLREFSDLTGVATFGFRGEALSSLCALSDMTVITRHATSATGTKLTYDSHGHISNRVPCSRQIGTTISLANLFASLPVRQKEFLRNLKKEFVKMTHLLYGYCLIAADVKISCVNQTKKGAKTVVVSTPGSGSVRDNIACIFGAKQAAGLLDLKQEDPSAEQLEELGIATKPETSNLFQLEGCISSCAHGQGRSSADRQFLYINSRPCEPAKVFKVINEVYHQFNMHQFPFVFLNIVTDRSGVDVNVTPDKRQIFLDNEKLLLASVKATLLKLYENIPCTFQMQNVNATLQNPFAKKEDSPTVSQMSPTADRRTDSVSGCRPGALSALLQNFSHGSPSSSGNRSSNGRQIANAPTRGTKRVIEVDRDHSGKRQMSLSSFIKKATDSSSACDQHSSPEKPTPQSEINTDDRFSSSFTQLSEEGSVEQSSRSFNIEVLAPVETERMDFSESQPAESMSQCSVESMSVEVLEPKRSAAPTVDFGIPSPVSPRSEADKYGVLELSGPSDSVNFESMNGEKNVELDCEENVVVICDEVDDKVGEGRREVLLKVDMDEITRRLQKRRYRSKEELGGKEKPIVKFYAEIDPSNNKSAEQELSREISKNMFAKMGIVGQFNLGFIITHLGNDLFIVDQHATDEKYNFETLERTTVIQNQKLVIPQTLELTSVNEGILTENIDIFRKNGFEFIFDENGPPTRRVQLTAKPFSQNWEFGREDIDELLFMLSDAPNTMCRPSRVRAMFASRACRKSVMIGTALSKSDMRRLINHMGEIEQPWNCPHGRPTMRHLINLEMVLKR